MKATTPFARSIILTGFMGTGKTEAGSLLAHRLGLPFVDIDRWIEERQGESVGEIFRRHGEFYFRQRERDAVRELAQGPPKVIATGGGTVAFIENRLRLRDYGILICFTADLKAILERTEGSQERPMLGSGSREERARELLKIRDESYRDCDHSIDTSALTPGEVVQEILKWLNEKSTIPAQAP